MTRPPPAVRLRPLRAEDAATIAGWAADPEFVRPAGWSADRSVAEHERHHARLIADPPTSLLRLGVEHEGELVGYVDLHGDDPERRELGFVVGGRERWGQGLGRAAAAAALDHAFGILGLSEVTAEADLANRRSVALLRGLGMRGSETGGRWRLGLEASGWPGRP